MFKISKRQLQIVNMVKKGMTNQDIADVLSLKLPTIKNHLWIVMRKSNIKSRTKISIEFNKNKKLFYSGDK